MFASLNGLVGTPPNGLLGNPDASAQLKPPGAFVNAVDNWWGGGEFIYGRANGSIRSQGLCVITPVFEATENAYRYNVTEIPNTANLGREVCINMNGAMTAGQFGWFMVSGIAPLDCQASVAADTTFGVAAAGQGGANSAGKQILGGRVVAAGAATVAKANCIGVAGGNFIDVPNSDGWFPGVFLSGTGVGAAARVTTIEPGGRRVGVSVVNSAAVQGTVTATYNNATIFYNVVRINRSFAQGAIT